MKLWGSGDDKEMTDVDEGAPVREEGGQEAEMSNAYCECK